jgi:hypothetical protein
VNHGKKSAQLRASSTAKLQRIKSEETGQNQFEKSFQYFWSFGALTFGIFHRHAVISGPVF